MKRFLKRKTREIILTFIVLVLLRFIIILDSEAGGMGLARVVLGSIGLLFLPGRWITAIAFKDNEIDSLERIALSIALSVSIIPLIVFYVNLAGYVINEMLILMVISILILICVLLSLRTKN